MGQQIDERARYFSETLRKKMSSNIIYIYLFGSRARGDAHEGSDYDFVVVVGTKDKSLIKEVRKIEVDFLNKFDTLSASLVYDEQEWERRKRFPIGINILREGVLL